MAFKNKISGHRQNPSSFTPKHIEYGSGQTLRGIKINTPGANGVDPYLENLETPEVPLGVNNVPLDIDRFAGGSGKG
jgi:hypothetical protein